jgi:alanyl-tRNA synthetase
MDWTTNKIRQVFLDFFKSKGHEIVDSAPIVIKDDPTLMFTNAGMNQFKGVFLGNSQSPSPRIADSQKCLRVSGKHNDLEEVGRDHYHHTMFEMLGNWSFGDYFKQDAINWSWELLTDVYGLDKDRLYVSIFGGDSEMSLDLDAEAKSLWRNHLPEDRILDFGRKENFWEMGETGPCGPCSEIHYDMRPESERRAVNGANLVNADDPNVIEIWNLVFMQFNRLEDGSLVNLKNKHIDTGMGLERLARALQGVSSNYDIDLFKALIKKTEELCGLQYNASPSFKDIAFRVIADHVRAVSFCIADGQLPASNGAGYVVRRVLRRAVRYGYSQLGIAEPFLYRVSEALAEVMGDQYPELVLNKDLVIKVIQEEEKSFLSTLAKGLERISTYISENPATDISGQFAFELYDTYGFPIDLTDLIADEHNLKVDHDEFQTSLEEQKARSRSATKVEFGDWIILSEGPNSNFLGYERLNCTSQVAKYRKVKSKGKDVVQLVLEETPFYAESGGQVGDVGVLTFGAESIKVLDTKKENGEIIHFVNKLPGNIDGAVVAQVDEANRHDIERNHSATHLLHFALRDELGKHVEQKGSLVEGGRLRFDFSHFEKIDESKIERIEKKVKSLIQSGIRSEILKDVPINSAKEMGAMALFGEKYGDFVRVVKFGDSVELCGGTHVGDASDIGGFKLLHESSIASGVRRIEAISGREYEAYVSERLTILENVSIALGKPINISQAIEKMVEEVKSQARLIESFRVKEKQQLMNRLESQMSKCDGFEIIKPEPLSIDSKTLKDIAFQLTQKHGSLIVIAGTTEEDKVSVVVAISKNLATQRELNAALIIKSIASDIEGGGGGQQFLAMAGGSNKKGLQRALNNAEAIVMS